MAREEQRSGVDRFLSEELPQALDVLGWDSAHIEPLVSPGVKRGRSAWRLELADGRILKVRRFANTDDARLNQQIRNRVDAALEPLFGAVVARFGALLFEAWIDGKVVLGDEEEVRAHEAGALLARLHGLPLTEEEQRQGTFDWADETVRGLATIEHAGALSKSETGHLMETVRDHDPGIALRVMTHRDYCAQNLVVDRSGRLCAIDNEWLTPDAAGFDLGRTRSRWPLSPAGWQRFLAGYRANAPRDPGPLAFWEIVGGVWSTQLRLDAGKALLAIPLERLRRLCTASGDG